MAPEKVIQDSDDEDFEGEIPTSGDPLQQSPPSPSLEVNGGAVPSLVHEDSSNANTEGGDKDVSPNVTSGADLNVDFDDFLRSQSQTGASPIQSRQRWEGEPHPPGDHIQSLESGGTGSAKSALWEPVAQSPLNSKLKRKQTISSLYEVEGFKNSNPKKPAKRCKTMDHHGSKAPFQQQLSPNTSGAHIHDNYYLPKNIERNELKEDQGVNAIYTPLSEEINSRSRRPSASQQRTQENMNEDTTQRQTPSLPRRSSIVSETMDDARDQYEMGPQMHTVNVQIAKGLTLSQEQEYQTLNAEGLARNITYNGHDQTAGSNNRGPVAAEEGSKLDETSYYRRIRLSTPEKVNSMKVVVAVSPHDTEQLSSSFSAPSGERTSASLPRGPSNSTPGDPLDEKDPKGVKEKKSDRKGMATVVDDSDDSPDELNPPTDSPEENRKPLSRRIRSTDVNTDLREDDDDIVVARPNWSGSRRTSRRVEHATEITEDGRSGGFESSNSDELGMPPKEQYRPRPSRSRGKQIEPEPEPPESPPRESKKRKIKRGKTTSVMLKKSVESDVEDDVVWVDENPSGVVFRDPILPAKRKAKRSGAAGVYTEPEVAGDEQKDITKDESQPTETLQERELPISNVEKPVDITVTVPKKRGRKPKKTEDIPVPAKALVEEPPAQQDKIEPNQKTGLVPDGGEAVDSPGEPQIDLAPVPSGNIGNDEPNHPEPENLQCSPAKPIPVETPALETPKKQTSASKTTSVTEEAMTPPSHSSSLKGPDKHSPISTTGSVPFRVGLSRRANIAPLLKVVRK